MSYNKLPRTYEEQLDILESRGLEVSDRASALHCLEHHNYYRISAYVRNLCAHHARLWNRRFTITVSLPRHQPSDVVGSLNPRADRHIYNTLVLLAHVVGIVEPENHWTHRLLALLRLQRVPVTCYMGFPENWQNRPIWQVACKVPNR